METTHRVGSQLKEGLVPTSEKTCFRLSGKNPKLATRQEEERTVTVEGERAEALGIGRVGGRPPRAGGDVKPVPSM